MLGRHVTSSELMIEELIQRVYHPHRIVPVAGIQIAGLNESFDLGDAQLDPEINKPIATSSPGPTHAFGRG
jgi:hypothetical protein